MKDIDITKIRQLLKGVESAMSGQCGGWMRNDIIKALGLLPCETCNDTKQVPTPRSVGFGHENEIMDTCPDCQSKPTPMPTDDDRRSEGYKWCEILGHGWYFGTCSGCQLCRRCGGINGVHKQVDDPQAGNSHMLTKMQCPLDPKNPIYY